MLNIITGVLGDDSLISFVASIPESPGGIEISQMIASHVPEAASRTTLAESDTSLTSTKGYASVSNIFTPCLTIV